MKELNQNKKLERVNSASAPGNQRIEGRFVENEWLSKDMMEQETNLRLQFGSTDSMVGLPSENVSVPKFMMESQS